MQQQQPPMLTGQELSVAMNTPEAYGKTFVGVPRSEEELADAEWIEEHGGQQKPPSPTE